MLGLHCCTLFSPAAASGSYSLVAVNGLLIVVPSVVIASGLTQVQYLWCTGLVAPQHVGSSWTRDRTHVSYVGRWILHH